MTSNVRLTTSIPNIFRCGNYLTKYKEQLLAMQCNMPCHGGPRHYGMERLRVADGDVLQIWRVAANVLNKQSRAADKGRSSSLGVGRGANNSSP
jgi:hypothetical protein